MTVRPLPDRASIGPDTPLRLEDAIAIAFPTGGLTKNEARVAVDEGRLVAYRLGGKLLTTLANVEVMERRQRPRPEGPGASRSPIGFRGYIYVVGFADYVKIGYTKRGPAGRIGALQGACPVTLIRYGIVRGTLDDEHHIHRRFHQDRLRGEWFRKSARLDIWIEAGCPL